MEISEACRSEGKNVIGAMADSRRQKYVGAVINGVKILRHLATTGAPEGVASIARGTEINTSTAFNILRTLAKERIVSFNQNDKTYELGIGVLEFSLPLLGRSQSDLIRPLMRQIVEKHKLLVALWTITPEERIILQSKFTPENVVTIELNANSRLPAYIGAVGRCYASKMNLPKAELRAKYESLVWAKEPGFDAYLKDVGSARKDGYATDSCNLFSGVDIAAAVICYSNDQPILGLSAIGLAGQHSKKELRKIGRDLSNSCRTAEKLLFSA